MPISPVPSPAGGAPLAAAPANRSTIAEATGGTCTEVTDPSQFSAALTGVNLTGVDRVEIEVNGVVGIATLDLSGRFSYLIPPDLLRSGRNDIIVRACGADELAGQVAVAETFVVRRGGPPGRP